MSLTPADATIMAFEDMIGHDTPPDCARESVKISSVSENSNASFEIRCKCVWRHCDV